MRRPENSLSAAKRGLPGYRLAGTVDAEVRKQPERSESGLSEENRLTGTVDVEAGKQLERSESGLSEENRLTGTVDVEAGKQLERSESGLPGLMGFYQLVRVVGDAGGEPLAGEHCFGLGPFGFLGVDRALVGWFRAAR